MSRYRLGFVALVLGLFCGPVAAMTTVHVPDGDTAALLDAFAQASVTGAPTEIVLARDGHYLLPASLVRLDGADMVVRGNDATLVSAGVTEAKWDMTTISAQNGAHITFENLHFTGEFAADWLVSSGELTLRGVTIRGGLQVGSRACTMLGPVCIGDYYGGATLIGVYATEAKLSMRDAVIDVEARYFPWEGDYTYTVLGIGWGAHADLQHVTMRMTRNFEADNVEAAHGLVMTQRDSRADIRDSFISVTNNVAIGDASSAACMVTKRNPYYDGPEYEDPLLVSHGGNVAGDPSCHFQHVAVSTKPVSTGASGYWNVPGRKGFLAVSFPNPGQALLVWSTFDAAGHAVTLYGLGRYVDIDTIEVDPVAVDRQAESAPNGHASQAVGRLRLDVDSCTDASLTFTSDTAELPSRAQELQRLTVLASVGCTSSATQAPGS